MTEQLKRARELTDRGGHFYRSDFQVHTPRDNQWKGQRPASEQERVEWATAFVVAAREKGLHAVAISDHHDFTFYPYVKKAAEEETWEDGTPVPLKERLVVFPALELTLTVPCQAIMILDADFPMDRLDSVLVALDTEPFDPNATALPSTTALPDSAEINDLHQKLDLKDWLRGRYIILPNVTPGGHQTLMRLSFQHKYREMVCVGGYLDKPISVFEEKVGDKKILDGEVKEWGFKRLGLFQTSDSRTADFSDLGERATWVKWTVPTAEAIRQACLAQESRLAQTDPPRPSTWISHISVSTSIFMGNINIALNPQYTALIGGRGTGKSTVLDYLRWALCDQPAKVAEDDEIVSPGTRQRKLIEATLKPLDAVVEVHCVINGIAHVVRRKASDGSVALKVGQDAFVDATPPEVQSLLPIQAYSQKQLSSVAIRTEELMRFVKAPILRLLENLDTKANEITGRLRENYGTLQRTRALSSEIAKTKVRVQSLGDQAQAMRDGLSGISDSDRLVLNEKAAFDDIRSLEASWVHQLSDIEAELRAFEGSLSSLAARIKPPDRLPDSVKTEIGDLATRITKALERNSVFVTSMSEEFSQSLSLVIEARQALDAKLADYDSEYAAVKARSSAHQTKVDELNGLDQQLSTARELLQKQESELDDLGDPAARHATLRQELVNVRRERTSLLKEQCDDLSLLSDGLIRASLGVGIEMAKVQDRFKGLTTGSSVRAAQIESFFNQLLTEKSPSETWEQVLTELETLTLLDSAIDLTSEQTPVLSRLGLRLDDQKRIAPRITPEGWLDLSLTEVSDMPSFEYRAKEDQYIEFESASAGQQASALLTTLLSQQGPPLIIDQPEEDLDSDTVQQIVSKIWDAKSRRQILFASHNANLVVNGDADLVLVCAYINSGDQSAGHIKLQGAIDVPEVRAEITTIMEGGERAFKLRKEKYGF